ncbi:syndecan-2 [Falco biarmicus]|uniref:Syndecan n=2 Tax=Falco TaxID=8952 RepID=A0A8C4VBI8_FALTI|nr:syndecan-2 [Falco cherrug]XP_056186985.1 syndecan-2 [Falco biarmicus]
MFSTGGEDERGETGAEEKEKEEETGGGGGKLLEFARGESRRRRRAASFHWLGELPICVVILQEFLRGLTGSRAAAAEHSGRRESGGAGSAQPAARAPQRRAASGRPRSGGAERGAERKERGGRRAPPALPRAPPGAAERRRPPVSPLCPAPGGRRAGSAGIMRGVWLALTVSFVACASGQPRADLTSDKDLYLDNSSVEEASGVYPIDDDDYSSGSGSGAEEDEDSAVITTSRTLPKLPTTSDASRAETTTVKMQTKVPAQTKSPEEIDKEERPETGAKKKSDEPGDDTDVFTEKHSENLFQRTEVLAAVIAGGVIGFLFAIFLILLLVYRMRKKDEGSYDLGERKPSCAAYQKAPTKEFYA